jgi:hypothetical protein
MKCPALVNVCRNSVTSYRLLHCSTSLHIQNCDIPLQWIMLSVILKHKMGKRAGWPVSTLSPRSTLTNPLNILFYLYMYIFLLMFTSWCNVICYSGKLCSVCFETIHRLATARQILEFKVLQFSSVIKLSSYFNVTYVLMEMRLWSVRSMYSMYVQLYLE